MTSFDLIDNEIKRGMEGKNSSIPMGFNRLNKFIGIRKRIYTVIFGATGTGKSSFMAEAFILNPFDWYLKNRDISPMKMKVILFSQERSKIYTLAKWLSRKIFLDQGILIPIGKMLGWWETKLTLNEKNLIDHFKDYINELCEFVDIIENPQNPTGIYKYCKEYAEKNGRIEEISEFKRIYIPNNENEIIVPIVDTFGLTKIEKGLISKKDAIDKVSEYFQILRDFYGWSPVGISQVNRDLSNPMYSKMDSIEPNLDQIKESGRPAEDSDCVISLFQPSRYKTNDPSYQVANFIDPNTGADYFRSIKLLKSSFSESDVKCSMAFQGTTGMFRELPRKSEMEGFDYNQLFTGSYFLK